MKNSEFLYKHPHTVWETIKNNLELDIINGVYKVGDRVPSINEIAKEYNVSCNTAGKVLDSLRADEIIMKRRGIGYFVLPYSKTKLIKNAKADFKKTIAEMVKFAQNLGFNCSDLVDAITEEWIKLPPSP